MTRPHPPVYLLAALLAMAALHLALPVARVLRFPWNLLGGIPFAIGVVLNLVADRAFSKSGTTVKPFEVSVALITQGVFRFSRHPMYLGFVLILLGLALVMGSLTPFVVVALFTLLLEVLFIRVEERMLAESFGDEWRAYRSRVRRWL